MPATIVVGGQYGSEGKGKVAHFWAQKSGASIAVRVGGPNSGHTVVDPRRGRVVFQQLPSAALLSDVICVLGPGSYVDPTVLLAEIETAHLGPGRLFIDPHAVVVTDSSRAIETNARLREQIGSTLSGTGAAVQSRVARDGSAVFVTALPDLERWVAPTQPILRTALSEGKRLILEGTQGFGLSLLHSPDYPFVTSRDTSAAGVAAEAGVSPLDVDDVVLVIRSYPIRVGGNSGPLLGEVDWETVRERGKHDHKISEFTTVTKRLRRVGDFDAAMVRQAIALNASRHIVMNHLDYIDHDCCVTGAVTERINAFLEQTEAQIGAAIDYVGVGPQTLIERTRRRKASSPTKITIGRS